MNMQAIFFARGVAHVHPAARQFGLVLSSFALAGLLAGCGQSRNDAPKPAAALPAAVQQVEPQRVPIAVEAVGQVEGSKEVEVRARVAGILLKRSYNEGDVVAAGATLFKIDPAPQEGAA